MKNLAQKVFRIINNEKISKFACKIFLIYRANLNNIKLVFSRNKIEIKKNNSKIIVHNKHLVYINDLINSFDFYFNQVKSQNGVVDYSSPQIHTLNPSGIPFFFTSFAEGEASAKSYLQNYRIKEGDIVFDCGAYCGSTTYFLSKAAGENGKVFAFEPDEENFNALLKNIELHNLKNVIPIKKGLWSKSDTLEFNEEASLGGAITSITARLFNKKIRKIEVVSLSDIFAEYNLDKINFVKMDIEGAEIQAIEGAKEFIKEKNINFAIASYHIVDGKMTYETLENIFRNIGYNFKTIKGFEGVANEIITYASKNGN